MTTPQQCKVITYTCNNKDENIIQGKRSPDTYIFYDTILNKTLKSLIDSTVIEKQSSDCQWQERMKKEHWGLGGWSASYLAVQGSISMKFLA